MKQKFVKNLFQTVSYFAVLVIFEVILLGGFWTSLSYEHNFGWILLIVALSLVVLFFLVGFYWVFQQVYIDESGIKIFFAKKIIKQYEWKEINTIEETNIMRNPAIRIKMFNGTEIHLDKRKSIIKALEKYSQKKMI